MNALGWVVFHTFILFAILIDLKYHKQNNLRKDIYWSLLWVMVALIFGAGIFLFRGYDDGLTYLTAYVIEKSLSIDNLFVFWIIFQRWNIPPKDQNTALMWGICSAIIFRAVIIIIGIKAIQSWGFIIYFFGGFLVLTGFYSIWKHYKNTNPTHHTHQKKNSSHLFSVSPETNTLWSKGKPTALLMAIIYIEWADIVFAIDSIPAVLGFTQDLFIVYTSNIMAIIGMRSLYKVLQHGSGSLHYLPYGIGIILIWVGLKMMSIISVSKVASLLFITMTLLLAFLASMHHKKTVNK